MFEEGRTPSSWRAPALPERSAVVALIVAGGLAAALGAVLVSGHMRLALMASLAILTIGVGAGAPRIGRMTAYAGLLVVQFVSVIQVFRPDEYNYFLYITVFALGILIGCTLVQPGRHSLAALALFGYILVSGLVFLGSQRATTDYGVFVFPLMALCYHELALYAGRREIKVVLVGFLVFVGVEATLGILQCLLGWPYFSGQTAMSSSRNPLALLMPSVSALTRLGMGTYAHFNGLGSILALALPFAFVLAARSHRVKAWAYAVLVALGLFLTFSRGAWLGFAVGGCAILLRSGSWGRRVGVIVTAALFVLVAVILASSTLGTYYSTTQNLTARLNTWQVAAADLSAHPGNALFGFGYSYYADTSSAVATAGSHVMSRLHSWLVEGLLELGVVGLLLLLACVLPPTLRGLQRDDDWVQIGLAGGILAFLTAELFDNSLFGATGVFMFLCLGLLRNLQRQQKHTVSLPPTW